ncbi:FMN-dependent NADH-azoreductase [Filimonas lacunae]|uniref:FMN dependent NADH:quinone oxidoreductase n=1 Tax=Filimonas lacunae TaxID=477680 RepID=A0A173MK09_9BACT|nr:FMN-dependent NADH-azoreductase [Filimonas lacunae]BAV07934.1 FMN-dependent NADH-azoreductase [Filimonas lacunae]SIT06811.1 FMN-dependent NADH-azoreductase [Filimonas lacunae]
MKILHLISSPRGADSVSIQLGNAIVEKLQAAYPDSTVTTRDLTIHPFPYLEEAHLQSFFTTPEQRTPALEAAVKHSDEAIAQLKTVDIIVIGAPMYNFTIPSTLKSWIDHIARAGETFSYSEKGPEGLIKGKKVYLAIAEGAIYSEGPMKAYDFVEPYLRAVLGFMGMTEVIAVRAEGVKIPTVQEKALEKAIASIPV